MEADASRYPGKLTSSRYPAGVTLESAVDWVEPLGLELFSYVPAPRPWQNWSTHSRLTRRLVGVSC